MLKCILVEQAHPTINRSTKIIVQHNKHNIYAIYFISVPRRRVTQFKYASMKLLQS